jgi:membrane-anchored glycerophosphoryl diester phosphodiesterase (GDPDase)
VSAALLVNFFVRQTGGPALTWYQVGLTVLSAMALTITLLVLAPFLIFFEYLFGLD